MCINVIVKMEKKETDMNFYSTEYSSKCFGILEEPQVITHPFIDV
jgi:hypothetical protein